MRVKLCHLFVHSSTSNSRSHFCASARPPLLCFLFHSSLCLSALTDTSLHLLCPALREEVRMEVWQGLLPSPSRRAGEIMLLAVHNVSLCGYSDHALVPQLKWEHLFSYLTLVLLFQVTFFSRYFSSSCSFFFFFQGLDSMFGPKSILKAHV